jgi:hypothetical protein
VEEMTKTPKELAKEYVLSRHDVNVEYSGTLEGCKDDFLAGYQAAAPQWISVKDCLLELNEHGYSDDVLLLSQDGRIEVSSIQKVKRVVKWRGIESVIETGNGTRIEEFTHWMPLPKLPEDK